MENKLILTAENVEKANEILRSFGYESDMRILNDYQFGSVKMNKRYANISYDDHRGFYVSTTGTWMHEQEQVELYIKELQTANNVFRFFNKLAKESI